MFNQLLLIACICIVVALILYFFYWNRFIAFIIGHAIRILFWNQEDSSIWIEIGSIHFSLLTGRILLKDVRYYSSNQTIKLVKGQIQWRYWIRRPTSEEELNSVRGEDTKHLSRLWSCRIQLSLQGVEWFLYNRTAAYDGIVEQMEKANRPASRSSSHRKFFSRFPRQDLSSPFHPPSAVRSSIRLPSIINKALAWFRRQLPTLDPKDLLPLGIEIQTGAIILGNPSTPNLLVAEFQHSIGTFGIVPSRSRYDLYKQVLGLKFHDALIKLVHNDDYVDPMVNLGTLVHSRIKQYSTLRKPSFYQPYRTFTKLWRQLRLYGLITEYFSTRRAQRIVHESVMPPTHIKKGKKTTDEDTPIDVDFSAFEYAIQRKILEAPTLELTYYVDVVGEVPSHPVNARYGVDGIFDIGNGDTPPEWGFDLVVYGGFLRYGPWADRQRAELQRAFFPPAYRNSEVTPTLNPGDKRVWAALHIFLELRDETTLYIPFREASKDWQWDGMSDIAHRPRKREAAAITVAVGDRSSINYVMPMIVGSFGYESTLEVHLDTLAISSSLNDIRLVSAESCRVRCELPAPVAWDAERIWSIAIYLRQPVVFLLRDHINMFTDLGKDWASGPPTDYHKFIPIIYGFKLEMHHFEMNLYANDQNIVDKPLIKEENALLILRGPHLRTSTTTPLNVFRPEFTSISFTVAAPDLVASLSLPRWNTHASHRKAEANVFKSSTLNIMGSYRYFSEVLVENVEQLRLDFDVKNAAYRAYGWSIRYLMVLRDNYLGSFTHFQTLSEYLDKRTRNMPVGDPIGLKFRPRKTNMFQVEISLRVERPKILLPIGLIGFTTQNIAEPDLLGPGADEGCISLRIPEVQMQFRIHDYYMEMSLNMDTITGSICHTEPAAGATTSSPIFLIDGIDITANRLFGPQPKTATYICLWEIAIGDVKASMSAREAIPLVAAANFFRLNFVDVVNAPAEDFLSNIEPDVTFYKVTTKTSEISWKSGHAAMFVKLQGMKFDSNDLGAHQYHKVTSLTVPHFSFSILLRASLDRNIWLEAAAATCDAYLDLYSSAIGHRTVTRNQLAFVEEQDKLTGRARQMFNQLRQRTKATSFSDCPSHRNGIYLPQPTLPRNSVPVWRTVASPHQETLRPKPPSWRLSTLADLSDSDGEEGVSEADRDARLARTRTSTPVAQSRGDDVTMSSGDESDDADLTDGDSTGNDWSDIGDSSNEQATGPLMSFYASLSRHYVANWFNHPSTWEGSPFKLTKEGAAFIRRGSDDYTMLNFSRPCLKLSEDIPKDEDITVVRLRFRKSVNLILNPLILPTVAYFENDIKSMVYDPELAIDSLMADAMGKISAKGMSRRVIYDIDLPQVMSQIIQHVGVSEEGNLRLNMEPTNTPSNLDIIAVVNLDLVALRLLGQTGKKTATMKASLNRVTSAIETSIDKRTISSSLPESRMFKFSLSSSSVNFSGRNVWVLLGGTSIELGHRGPELAIASYTALLSTGSSIVQLVRAMQIHSIAEKRVLLDNLLDASKQGPVIDPLSTIQPSYLVQTGLPHLLRTDVGFKFLYHLRTTSWNFRNQDRRPPRPFSLDGMVSSVESRLTLLDPDACNINHLDSMDPNFFMPGFHTELKQPKSVGIKIEAWSAQLGKATVTILAPTGAASSQFVVNSLSVDLESKTFELVQVNFNSTSSASQTSLRSKSSKFVRKGFVSVSLGDIELSISPQLMDFAQQLLRLQRQYPPKLGGAVSPKPRVSMDGTSTLASNFYSLEVLGAVRQLRVQAGAENLVLVMGITGIQSSTTLLYSHNQDPQSVNHSTLFDQVYLQARSPADPAKGSDLDILAALAFTGGRVTAVARPEPPGRNLKLAFKLSGLRLHVPRSALRLYHFIGEWRADYLPGMEAAMRTLLTEYNARLNIQPLSPTPSRQSRRNPIIQIHGQINHFEISLQVMHGTWLSLEINKTVGYAHSLSALMSGLSHAFGLQVASMVLNVSSKPDTKEEAPSSRIKLALPSLSLAGQSDGHCVNGLILFDFIDLKVKPSHWDTLLVVQQKFGQDFNDLVALMQKTRQKGHSSRKPSMKQTVKYEAQLKMRGFRVGLEGVSSTVLLECQDINGNASNASGWVWDVGLSDLALSLAPRLSTVQRKTFSRNHRSAFVIIDFKLSGSGSEVSPEKALDLSVTKTHAVMQPSSIGEFGDFIDDLQAEMLERQELRATELAAFKEKAQSILKTFDVNVGDVPLEQASVNNFIITVSIRSIGVAFPLTHDEELELPHKKTKDSAAVRAFLLSVKSIEFGTHRGETGQAAIHHLSFQFISRFRQSFSDDFTAEKHNTRNCLFYPEMKAQLRSSSSGASRKIWVKANVSGFVLDIDSTIPSYIYSLIDVYRQGKERVDRLSASVPRTPTSSIPTFVESVKPSLEKRYTAIPTSNVISQLIFLSGKVRLFSGSASQRFKAKPLSSSAILDITDDQVLEHGAEVFNLPVVSVWGEYRATPAVQKLFKGTEQEPSILMFNTTVHSSQNALRPTLLPFLTELINQIEVRMRKVSSHPASEPLLITSLPYTPSTSPNESDERDSVSSMQISFSLRIDKSKLELTCQPDVNVIAGLHWENGGFVINISPGARNVSFFGSVSGLTVGLKHGFLSEDCVKLDARNLSFSVSFAKTEPDLGSAINAMSIVLETEFLGGVRFSRLQDILCFKAVWLDRIPVFNTQSPHEEKVSIPPVVISDPIDPEPKNAFSIVILLRIRKIKLEVDLGQSIARIDLELHQSVFRTKLTDAINEVFIHVGDVLITAQGNMSGRATVSSCVFQTIRRSEIGLWDADGQSKMLELRLTSGALVAAFESDHQKLLHYRAEPLEVEILDDWSKIRSTIEDRSRPLQLSFTITCPEIIAVVTVGTIPKLLSYMNKFKANLDAQRQGASRESQTFRFTQNPKPDNPLSAVAEAMLVSARSRFKEAESGLLYVIRQHMSLRLDLLRLIVFPRTMRDVEIAQFIGRDVQARLDGLVGSDSSPAQRDLHLSFSSMTISKYTQVTHPAFVPPHPLDEDDGQHWLATIFKDATEATIVGLPSMKMHMISEEVSEDSVTTIIYDFHSEFVRRVGMKAFEDIYITLNMSLYSWLTVLRKNLTREMEQVRAAEDWRTSMNNVSTGLVTGGSQRKRKPPEPLSLHDSPRSTAISSGGGVDLSPFGPSSVRLPLSSREPTLSPLGQTSSSPAYFPLGKEPLEEPPVSQDLLKRSTVIYKPRNRHIERLTMRQLGEATPDVMHPFFMKKAGFNLEDSLPQYVNEYATVPLEEIMEVLLKLYSQQLRSGRQKYSNPEIQ